MRLHQALQGMEDRAGWIIANQYLRSATAIGANIAEARSGESRADFIHKYSIAQKEARESLYWLRLLGRAEIVAPARLEPLIAETEELTAIVTAIILKAKGRSTQPPSSFILLPSYFRSAKCLSD